MKHQQKNHHFARINASDIYYVRGAWVGASLDGSVLTSVFITLPTSPLNITHYSNTNLKALVVLPLLCHTSILDRRGFLLSHSVLRDMCPVLFVTGYQN